MHNTKTLLAAVVLAAGLAAPLLSQADRLAVDIDIGPPAPVVEAPPPPPQPGYVWAPGFYRWDGGRHVWVPGRYIAPHPGHHWVADHWEPRGPHYHYVPGHWAR